MERRWARVVLACVVLSAMCCGFAVAHQFPGSWWQWLLGALLFIALAAGASNAAEAAKKWQP